VAERAASLGVASWDDIPTDPIGDPVRAESPALLTSLARILGSDGGASVSPLRDATCRSFPVWEFDRALGQRLAGLSADALEALAAEWHEAAAAAQPEADLAELQELLAEIRSALADDGAGSSFLYVLLEEKAL
jgi:hypothetical protein